MKIAVCDDCQTDVRRLETFLKEQEITVYESAAELLADIRNEGKWFDLYIIDISLRRPLDGLDLARTLRLWNEDAVICFTSESGGFYREAYDVYAVQYLIKPVQAVAVGRLLGRLERSAVQTEERRISYQWRGKMGFIPYEKILYVTSHGHTLSIYCTDGSAQECTGKLNVMEEKIDGETFCRCHQSFLVNMHYVDTVSGSELVIGSKQIPVSRRYSTEVRRRYQEMLSGRMGAGMSGK